MTETDSQKLPEWVRAPFVHFLNHIKQSHNFYHLSIDGILMIIHSARRVDQLTTELEQLEKESGFESQVGRGADKDHDKSRERAELAQNEADHEFPVLHQQATVDLWGSLESFIQDFAASWLANEATATQIEAVRRIKIRLADYEAMTSDERYRYVAEELERESGAIFKQGASRFEDDLPPENCTNVNESSPRV